MKAQLWQVIRRTLRSVVHAKLRCIFRVQASYEATSVYICLSAHPYTSFTLTTLSPSPSAKALALSSNLQILSTLALNSPFSTASRTRSNTSLGLSPLVSIVSEVMESTESSLRSFLTKVRLRERRDAFHEDSGAAAVEEGTTRGETVLMKAPEWCRTRREAS